MDPVPGGRPDSPAGRERAAQQERQAEQAGDDVDAAGARQDTTQR